MNLFDLWSRSGAQQQRQPDLAKYPDLAAQYYQREGGDAQGSQAPMGILGQGAGNYPVGPLNSIDGILSILGRLGITAKG